MSTEEVNAKIVKHFFQWLVVTSVKKKKEKSFEKAVGTDYYKYITVSVAACNVLQLCSSISNTETYGCFVWLHGIL